MSSALVLLVLLPSAIAPPQEDEAVRERIRKLVEFLEGVLPDTRIKAADDLGRVPVRFAPFLRELGAGHKNSEVRAILDRLAVPEPWPSFLRGSLGEAAAFVGAIRGAESQPRSKAVAGAIYILSDRPAAEIRRWAGVFLSDPDPRIRDLGLQVCKYWPPDNTESIREMLKDPAQARRAAEALISAGDEGAVPAALEAYLARETPRSHAGASILRALGVPEGDVDKVIDNFRVAKGTIFADPPMLGPRAGRKGIEALIELCRDGNPRTTPSAMEVVAWVMGDEALPLARTWREELAPDRKDRGAIPTCLRDPSVAHGWIESLGPEPSVNALTEGRKVAWYAGPELRDPILAKLKDPATPLVARKELVALLGELGRAEDVPFLLESLADARLAEGAGEALEKIGDRSHGKAVMRAFLQSRQGHGLAAALITLDVAGPEEDLVELITNVDSYGSHAVMAVRLAGRRLTPRLRDLVLERYPKWDEYMQRAAERMLLDPDRRGDAELINRLQAQADPDLVALGHHLDMLNGNASRAPAAAMGARIKGVARNWQMGGFRLDRGAEAGEAWTEAVEAEWKKSPDWHEATVWLAARGRKGAMEKVRARLETETGSLILPMMAALAAGGDGEQLENLWLRAFAGSLSAEEDEVILVLARRGDETTKARLLALARGEQATSYGPGHRLAARLTLPEAIPVFRLAVTRCDQGYHGGARPFDLAACISALGRLKDRPSIPAIRRHLRSGNEVVRIAAMDALAELMERDAVLSIARFIDDPTDTRRQAAAGWFHDAPPVRRVWHHAMDALEKITGEKPPAGSVLERRDFWRAWQSRNRKSWK